MSDNNINLQNILPVELSRQYQIQRLLGEGANAKTWLARNIINGQQVAIKAQKFDDFKSVELYEREISVMKSIDIHGVPKFYDSWFSADKTQCFLIQEFIDAPSLQNALDNHYKFSESETLNIIYRLSAIVHSLQSLYSPPIIHRDIKPSNILYKKAGNSYEVWLIDFGAVANPEKRSGGSTIAGTFGYMGPEQMNGDVVIQSDYYAIGVTALHMMTGVPPYNLTADMYKINYNEVLKTHAPKTSQNIKDLLATLMAPEIEKRPANAQILRNYIVCAQNNCFLDPDCILVRRTWWRRAFDHVLALFGLKKRTRRRINAQKSATPIHEVPSEEQPDNQTEIEQLNQSETLEAIRTIREIQEIVQEKNQVLSFEKNIKDWVECDGIIQNHMTMLPNNNLNDHWENKDHAALEYTFEAENRTWVGFCFIKAFRRNMLYPIPCRVIYDPQNPRRNALMDFKQ